MAAARCGYGRKNCIYLFVLGARKPEKRTDFQKADVLNKHELTEDHRTSRLMGVDKTAALEFQLAVNSSKSKSETAVIGAMKILYFQAKECIATRKFKSIKDLLSDLGVEALDNLKSGENASHDSFYAIREMEAAICEVIEDNMLAAIKNSRWYSISIDESTDVSTTQSVIVYLKIVNKGIVSSSFLELKALSGCTAVQIFEAVAQVLSKFGVHYHKISSLGTDGASNMVGVRNGVSALFKAKCDTIINIHCSAHRLALASGQAADTDTYLVKFQDIINRVYKYFQYSPKKTVFLKEVQDLLDLAQKRFVQTFSTRWLSFHKSVNVILEHWPALVHILVEDRSAIGQGLLKCVTNFKFLSTAAYLSDILFLLNELCLTFLKSNVDFSVVRMKVDSCMKELELISETGTVYMSFLDKVPKAPSGQFEYAGHVVRDSEKMRSECANVRKRFMSALLNNLRERFAELPLIAQFDFLLPVNLPKESDPAFNTYGVEDIKKVCKFFSSNEELNDVVKMVTEWKLFKRILATRCKTMRFLEFIEFIHLNALSEIYPIITSVYEFVATLPLSTVDCERGFSLMNLTKTDLRNRLSVMNLSNLMMINLEGPERKDFDFKCAFMKWCNAKQRRL